jgi:hypothetical protein
MSNVARTLYQYVAGLFLVGVVVEFFLAGLGVFGLQSDATDAGTTLTDASFVSRFDPHLMFGDVLFGVSLVLILVAVAARLDRRTILTTVGLFALMSVQATFAFAGTPVVRALHAALGVAIFGAAAYIFVQARALAQRQA